jgi:hypothetical protein
MAEHEPLCVVAILKSGAGLENRSLVLENPEIVKSIADWLDRNFIPNTRMSVRAYEALVAARNELELRQERLL